jgi:hypothetical protein
MILLRKFEISCVYVYIYIPMTYTYSPWPSGTARAEAKQVQHFRWTSNMWIDLVIQTKVTCFPGFFNKWRWDTRVQKTSGAHEHPFFFEEKHVKRNVCSWHYLRCPWTYNNKWICPLQQNLGIHRSTFQNWEVPDRRLRIRLLVKNIWSRCESIRTLYRTKPCRGNPRNGPSLHLQSNIKQGLSNLQQPVLHWP